MTTIEVTENELQVLTIIRTLALDEFLEVSKSRDGKLDSFFLSKNKRTKFVIETIETKTA